MDVHNDDDWRTLMTTDEGGLDRQATQLSIQLGVDPSSKSVWKGVRDASTLHLYGVPLGCQVTTVGLRSVPLRSGPETCHRHTHTPLMP